MLNEEKIDPNIMNVSIKNKLIANLRQSRKKYFSSLINMYSKNLNEIWKIIKTITYKNRQSISIPNSSKNADETPIGEHDIADALNNFLLTLVQIYQRR